MPRDLPDWGGLPAPLTVHEVTDLGELAARLGSVVTYHRGGIVLFVEDFADGMNRWVTVVQGAGDVVDLSLTRSLNGLLSARLLAASILNPLTRLYTELPRQIPSVIGGEIAFSMDGATGEVQLELSQHDGNTFLAGSVLYDPVNDLVRYIDSAGNWTTLASSVNLVTSDYVFHRMKLVTDIVNEEYVKVLLDDQAYSLSGVALHNNPVQGLGGLSIQVTNQGVVGESHAVYVDRVIVTQNEPL